MTEQEARKKACCNGAKRPEENGPCIGSACMAWRETRDEQYVSEGAPPPGPEWRKCREHLSGADWELIGGFCGLAGKP